MTIGILEALAAHSQNRPEAVACVDHERSWSFRQLQRLSDQLAERLQAEGVAAGDRIAVLTRSHLDALVVLLAALRLGAIFMPLNWRLASDELAFVLQHGAPRLVIADADLSVGYAEALAHVPHWCDVVRALSAEQYSEAPPRALPASSAEAGLLLYSSGTTGRPKGVLLSANGVMSAVRAATAVSTFGAGDSMANALPVFHIAGVIAMLVPLVVGGRLEGMDKFEPRAFVETLGRRRISQAILVPSMIQMLLAELVICPADLSSLRQILYAGSPIGEPVLKAAMEALTCDFTQIYGLTEASGVATVLSAADHRDPALWRSAGRPAAEAELQIVAPQSGTPLAEGEVGEIWVRSVRTMRAYWNDPEATAQACTASGWLRTGDCGHMRDGYLYITDRLKDQIVSGGENVYPAEVERVLVQHPAVADCAVIGVPDAKWGETVKACVVLRPGAEAAAAELISFCREHLAHYKCPRSVDFHDALPRNASGKVLKRELRAPYWEGLARSVS